MAQGLGQASSRNILMLMNAMKSPPKQHSAMKYLQTCSQKNFAVNAMGLGRAHWHVCCEVASVLQVKQRPTQWSQPAAPFQ